MSEATLIPHPAPADLPTFTVKVGGAALNLEYQVASVVVQKSVNRIATAMIAVLDGDPAAQDFRISGTEDLVPGGEIEILAGYHSDEATVFKGVIVSQTLKARKGKPSMLYIECKDKAAKLTLDRKSAYYKDMKDSAIMEEILGASGVEAEVEETPVEHKGMVHYHATDWDFLLMRAEVNGMLVLVDDGKISVKAPDTSVEPVLTLAYGATLMEFEAQMDARRQIKGCKSSAWDHAGQELVEEEGADPGLTEPGNLSATDLAGVMGPDPLPQKHTGKVAGPELKAWADARLLRSRLAKIQGRARCQGFAGIKPGDMFELGGVGDRFSGKHFVAGVRHQIDARNWETDIQLGMSDAWFAKTPDIAEPSAAGLLPGVKGLQIGVVAQLADDPDGEDRVLIRMPVVGLDGDGIWARVATLDAGENRGSFFRPEIGDEVVLGFLNEDPRDAVILGMLNSSAKPAPIAASDDNHEKGFVTRSEMKMVFNDDDVSFTLETPNGNKITVSDAEGSIVMEDENGNTIEMSADGITLDSAKDIILKAAGDIKMEGVNIELKASGDVKVEGVNCEIKATAEIKAEGGAGAELKSAAITKVKGSLVQIN